LRGEWQWGQDERCGRQRDEKEKSEVKPRTLKSEGCGTRQLRLKFPESPQEAPRFWQRRFYDFNVWSHAKKKEKLHYMHANPVRERLARHPKDWPWSSFSFYATGESELIRVDPVD
jgi:REP element-mobilizing transposase RayT